MLRLPGRAVRATVAVGAVLLAYVGGVATGAVGSHETASEASGAVGEAAGDDSRDATGPADTVSGRELRRAAAQGMLQDPWSRFYSPVEYDRFQARLNGRYSGVGLWLREGSRAGGVRVLGVRPGSPAEQAGVRAGDVIMRVAGRSTRTASTAEVTTWLRGRPRSDVPVVIAGDSQRRRLSLTRTVVRTRDVSVHQLDGGATLVRVMAFTRGVGSRVRDAVVGEGADHGIVLDLRGNPGGLLDEAVATASSFLDGGPVVSYQRRGEGVQRLYASGGGDTTTPLVVLVNGGTASAAEVVAAALEERGRAVIVGSRTFGKASVQEPLRLPGGSAVKLTVGRYFTPSGRNLAGTGVSPDVPVPPGTAPDVAMRRAVDVLNGLVAALPSAKERS